MAWGISPWAHKQIVERCAALYADGNSGAKIAKALNSEFAGVALSRNAVCGHLWRMQYTPRKTVLREKPVYQYRGGGRPGRKWKTKATSNPEPVLISAPTSLQIPLTETNDFHCRYIEGDDALCCGRNIEDGQSWCAYHCTVVFCKPAPRPEKKPKQFSKFAWSVAA